MQKFLLACLSGLVFFTLTGCRPQSAASISADGIRESWTFGQKYDFTDQPERGRGRLVTVNQTRYSSTLPIKIKPTTQELKLTLKYYPDGITFCLIDQVLVACDQTANSTETIYIPLKQAQLTAGEHQLNLMQFQQDDRRQPLQMNHVFKYVVE